MSKWLMATMALSLSLPALAHDRHDSEEREQQHPDGRERRDGDGPRDGEREQRGNWDARHDAWHRQYPGDGQGNGYGRRDGYGQHDRDGQRDDWRDLRQLEQWLSRFDAAQSRPGRGALLRLESDLRSYVRSEIDECRAERDRARQRHDERAAWAEEEALRRTRDIARELDGLYGRLDGHSLHRERRLTEGLLRLERMEQERGGWLARSSWGWNG